MWIITTLAILFFLITCGLLFACYNMLKKIEVHEDWLNYFRTEVNEVQVRLNEIDKGGMFASSVNEKGLFEKDDDVGFVFSEILRIITEFNDKIK